MLAVSAKKDWLYSPSHFNAIHDYMETLNTVQSCTTVQSIWLWQRLTVFAFESIGGYIMWGDFISHGASCKASADDSETGMFMSRLVRYCRIRAPMGYPDLLGATSRLWSYMYISHLRPRREAIDVLTFSEHFRELSGVVIGKHLFSSTKVSFVRYYNTIRFYLPTLLHHIKGA